MLRKIRPFIVCTLFLVAAAASAAPAAKAFAVVVYADGNDLSVYRNNQLRSFDPEVDAVLGTVLYQGDLVQTGRGTLIEIQLLPSQSVLRVGENTSIRLTQMASGQSSLVELIYGRIRAKVDHALGSQGFVVQGSSVSAGVRGTDFGYDLVSDPTVAAEPVATIACYEGKIGVQIRPAGSATVPAASDPEYALAAGKVVHVAATANPASSDKLKSSFPDAKVSTLGGLTLAESAKIDPEVSKYWEQRPSTPNLLDDKQILEMQDRLNGYESKGVSLDDDQKREIAKSILDEAPGTTSATTAPGTTPDSTKTQVTATQPKRLADTIAPLPTVSVVNSITLPQYVLAVDPVKATGFVLTVGGLATSFLGLGFGSLSLGIDPTVSKTVSEVSIAAGGTFVVSGIILYLIGCYR